MSNTWRTLPDGRVEVNGSVPLLEGGVYQRLWQWYPLAREHEARTGVPASWTLGMIHAESGGQAGARSSDGGLGLMQITHPALMQGLSPADVMRPEVNLRLGTDFLRTLRTSGPASARDLPSVSSRYNAGQKTNGAPHASSNAWGMRCTGNHIDRVVAATNSVRSAELQAPGEQPAGGGGDALRPFPDEPGVALALDALKVEVAGLRAELAALARELGERDASRLVRAERMLRAALNAAGE